MKKEAEEHAEEDKKRKEKVEIRNNGDALAVSSKKMLDELKDKISDDDKKKIEKAIKELQVALSGDDTDKIKKKTDDLSETLQKVSTQIYQQAAQQAQQQQQAGGQTNQDESWQGHPGSNDDKTIDADYKVKKDKEKDKK
jgi:molecular chaperone DnaK